MNYLVNYTITLLHSWAATSWIVEFYCIDFTDVTFKLVDLYYIYLMKIIILRFSNYIVGIVIYL